MSRWVFPSLQLAPRIVLGVGVGLTAIFLLVGAVALATVNSAADAAGREQVVLAEELAAQIGADSAQDELTELLSPGIRRTSDSS